MIINLIYFFLYTELYFSTVAKILHLGIVQFKQAEDTANKLELDGLVVIGGDDSNTNACLIAEYFRLVSKNANHFASSFTMFFVYHFIAVKQALYLGFKLKYFVCPFFFLYHHTELLCADGIVYENYVCLLLGK